MKYIDADKLKAMLKERQEEKDYREVIWLIDSLQQDQLANIVDFVIKNYKPSLPEGLEEAAREYAKEYTKNEGNGGDDWEDDIQITFKAGAEWQKAKMMEGAVEGTVVELGGANKELSISVGVDEINKVLRPLGLKEGDKVRVIVIKEE